MGAQLIEQLKRKLRDTFLYEYASERVTKPVYFYVIVAIGALTGHQLSATTSVLKRGLPVRAAAPQSWTKPFVEDCAVLNIAAWNRSFPRLKLSRISLEP